MFEAFELIGKQVFISEDASSGRRPPESRDVRRLVPRVLDLRDIQLQAHFRGYAASERLTARSGFEITAASINEPNTQ